MSRSLLRLAAPLALALTLVAAESQAVPVPPGGAPVALAGTTAAATPDLAGVVVQDVMRPFAAGPIKGFLQDRIVRSNATGTLHFYYRIILDAKAPGRVTAVRKFGFDPAAAPTDANWRMDGMGTRAPIAAQRTADGAWVSFNHLVPAASISPGESSRFVFVKTRAKEYKLSGKTLIVYTGGSAGGGTITVETFRPIY
jgi:hypothetical protein